LIIFMQGYLQGECQTSIVDSLRSSVQKINDITPDSSCKKYKDKIEGKIAEYKSNISKIHSTTLAKEVAQFLSADTLF